MWRKNFIKPLSRLLAALLLMSVQVVPTFFVFGTAAASQDHEDNEDKITICHRTNSATNPYTMIEVSKNAVDGEAGNSGQEPDHYGEHKGPLASSEAVANQLKDDKKDWGDIIPPVSPYHNGLNWTTEGQAIYNNDCNYPKEEKGSITILKNAIKDSSQVFTFTTLGLPTDNSGFSLIDDSTPGLPSKVFTNLDDGSYIINENEVNGWYLDGVTCSGDDDSIVDITKNGVKITLSDNEDISCTFTNRQSLQEEEPGDPYVRVSFICKATFNGTALVWDGTQNQQFAVQNGDYVFRIRYESNNSDANAPSTVPYQTTQFVANGDINKGQTLFRTTNQAVAGVKVLTTPTNLYNGTASTNENQLCEELDPENNPFVRVTFICKATFDGITTDGVNVGSGDYVFRIRYEADKSDINAPATVPYQTTKFVSSGDINKGQTLFRATGQSVAGVKVLTTPTNLYNGTASTNEIQLCQQQDPEDNPYVRVTFICKATFNGTALVYDGQQNQQYTVSNGDYVFRIRYENNNSDTNAPSSVPYTTTQFVTNGTIDKDQVIFDSTSQSVAGVKVLTTPTNLYNGTASTNENQLCEQQVDEEEPTPAIQIVKSGPEVAEAGTTVTYTFEVSNVGDMDLYVAYEDITDTIDDITTIATYVSGDINDDNVLELGEKWLFERVLTILENQVEPITNIGKVCGVPYFEQRFITLEVIVENRVCDEDDHTTFIPQVLGTSITIDDETPLSQPQVLGTSTLAVTGDSTLIAILSGIAIIFTALILQKAVATDK